MNSTQLSSMLQHSGLASPFLLSMISVWGLGIITFAFRKLPMKLWRAFLSRFTVSVRMTGISTGNLAISQAFLTWFMDTKYAKNGRRFTLDASHRDRQMSQATRGIRAGILAPGIGTHFFFYKSRLAWFTRDLRKEDGESTIIEVFFLGRQMAILEDFVGDLKPKKNDDEVGVYTIDSARTRGVGWELSKHVPKRDIASVIIRHDIKDPLIESIKEFYANKDWYRVRGIRHKLVILFHGDPGTGKSSLIQALASYFDKSMYFVNMNSTTDTTFQSAMDRVPEEMFIVIEDIDVGTATAEREGEEAVPVTADAVELQVLMEKKLAEKKRAQAVSMSTILNTLDGVSSLSGNVVFLSTNHLDKLDRALIRRGRVDKVIEIPRLRDAEIREYISIFYPEAVMPDDEIEDMLGCDVQGEFLDNKHDFNSFWNQLPLKKNTISAQVLELVKNVAAATKQIDKKED